MRHASRIAAFAVACSSLLALSACGSEEVALSKSDPYYAGAKTFSESCAGCHTLSVAGTQGSAVKASDKERTDGPNFNARKETKANVLYALRNGGFSGKIMPQNLVTGAKAEEVAGFLAKYAGAKVKQPAAPVREVDSPAATNATTPPAGATKPATGGE